MKLAKTLMFAAAAATILTAGASALADPAPAKVEDFRLSDHDYVARELYRLRDAKAVVLITYAVGDAATKADAPAYKALKAAYAPKGVEFMMLDSKIGDTRDRITADAAALGIDMPILMDRDQLVGEGLAVTRTAEVIVIDPRRWTIAYRGPAAAAGQALEGLAAGREVAMAPQAAKGALIAFPLRDRKESFARISYAEEIAPIVRDKCATCHQPGGIGPMTLNTYEQVKAHAPMIRETIRTQRMPPFRPEPGIAKYKDDHSITAAQAQKLVHWIEAGAPRGRGADPLAQVKFQAPEWPLGKPDLIIEVPAFSVPATGIVDYQRPFVANPMTEGRWMRANTFRVSDRKVVHHILTGFVGADKAGQAGGSDAQLGAFGGYGPGRLSNTTPPDMGVWVPPGGGVVFQNHYTPYGKATTEKTQMGIYFYPKGQEPKHLMRTFGMFDFGIQIPAGAEFHREVASVDIPHEALIYGFTPHAHTRGASANVSIRFPDGKEQMLLVLPKYDFNWQYEYMLEQPVKAPPGSKIVTRWTYDNSPRNHANPDPKHPVTWGEQTSEEMLALYFHYRWTDETVASQKPQYANDLQQNLMLGVLDDNLDGKLQAPELKGAQSQALKTNFAMIDANKDGGVDKTELQAAMQLLNRGRRPAAAGTQ